MSRIQLLGLVFGSLLLAVGGMEGPRALGQMCPVRGASPESMQDQLTLRVWLGDFKPLEGKVFL